MTTAAWASSGVATSGFAGPGPYTFDGDNLTIIMAFGTTEVDMQQLYSDWKEWKTLDDNSKYYPAFDLSVGGNPLTPEIDLGDYYFLRTDLGWRIRPYEGDHELTVNGNLYASDVNFPIFSPTLGSFQVLVKQQLSSLTQTVTDSGIAEAILDEPDSIETGVTVREALRLILAATAGKVSGGGTNTITFRNASADTKNRIVATVDDQGNRSAIVYDVSD